MSQTRQNRIQSLLPHSVESAQTQVKSRGHRGTHTRKRIHFDSFEQQFQEEMLKKVHRFKKEKISNFPGRKYFLAFFAELKKSTDAYVIVSWTV